MEEIKEEGWVRVFNAIFVIVGLLMGVNYALDWLAKEEEPEEMEIRRRRERR